MIRPLALVAAKLADVRFLRYLAASIGALAMDVGAFLACLTLGVAAGPASALGYSLGILAHWLMSSRAVFRDSVAASGRERTRQKALFVISALLGLVLTTLIITLADRAGMDPRVAKGGAVVVSFLATWLIRSRLVFQPRHAA